MHLWWAATFWLSDISSCPHSLSRLVLQKAHLGSRAAAAAPFLCPDMAKGFFVCESNLEKEKKKKVKKQDKFHLQKLVDSFSRDGIKGNVHYDALVYMEFNHRS